MEMKMDPYKNKDVNPVASLSYFIWQKDEALSQEFCDSLIEKFDKDPDKYDGHIGEGVLNQRIKQTKDLGISSRDNWKEEDDILYESLRSSMEEYNTHIKSLHPDTGLNSVYQFKDTGYQIQRYEPGGFYDWHNDWTMSQEDGSRVYTYIWYLNTLKKKDGGYTQFVDGSKIQPKAGKVVLFPATWNYLHRAFPATKRKYICTGWVYAKL